MTDSSLKPTSCLSHGVASLGEQSQAVCSTKFRDSAAGDTITSSLMQIREDDRGQRFGSPRRVHSVASKPGTSSGKSGGRKRQGGSQVAPQMVFECLQKDSRKGSIVKETELEEESDEEDSESEGMSFPHCNCRL